MLLTMSLSAIHDGTKMEAGHTGNHHCYWQKELVVDGEAADLTWHQIQWTLSHLEHLLVVVHDLPHDGDHVLSLLRSL